jgi:catechol 2,3-dioxygenase-like lactoylglutathione lyase family enzyme
MDVNDRIVGLHHIALGAKDVERVVSFYCDVLGLRELTRHHYADGQTRSVWLDLRGVIVMIEKTDRTRKLVQGVDAGPFLIAFAVEASKRVGLEQVLESSGYPVELRTEYTSYFRDPEGNRVAISCYELPERPFAPPASEIR